MVPVGRMFHLKSYSWYVPDEIDRWGEEPLYQQLAAILRAQIEDGTYQPGGRLPSEVACMQRYHLARNTIRQALKVLRDQGYIQTRGQRGSRVLPRSEWHPGEH